MRRYHVGGTLRQRIGTIFLLPEKLRRQYSLQNFLRRTPGGLPLDRNDHEEMEGYRRMASGIHERLLFAFLYCERLEQERVGNGFYRERMVRNPFKDAGDGWADHKTLCNNGHV